MRTLHPLSLPLWSSLVALVACTSPDVNTTLQLQLGACAPGEEVCPDPGTPPPSETGVGCTELMIRDVRLDAGGDEVVDERTWQPIDLADPDASLVNLAVPAGDYDRIRLKIEPKEGFAPGPSGRKVSTHVCVTIDGVSIEYRDDTYDTFELRPATPIHVADGELARLVARFDVASWFDGVDVASLELTGGVALIDEEHNPGWQDVVRDQIKNDVDLVREP